MRCPECHFVCSDLRDLCPKCLLDFRPHKAKHHIAITSPHANYEELVAKVRGKVDLRKKVEEQGTSLIAKLFSLFGAKAPEQWIPTPKELRSPGESTDETYAQKRPARFLATKRRVVLESTPSALPPSSNIDREIETLLSATSSAPNSPAREEVLEQLAADAALEPIISEPQAVVSTGQAHTTIVSIDTPIEPNLEVVWQEEPLEEEDEFIGDINVTSVKERFKDVRIEAFAAASGDDVSHYFANVAAELHVNPPMEFELSFSELASELEHEYIELYFDLAKESFDDPDALSKYVQDVALSQKRQVEATALQRELKKVERVTELPAFSLKKGAHVKTASLPIQEIPPHEVGLTIPVAASVYRRLGAAFVDFLILLILSIAGGLAVSAKREDTLFVALTDALFEHIDRIDLILPIATTASVFIVSIIVYPLISCLVLGRTIGFLFARLRVVSSNGSHPSIAQMLVRIISLPLSVATLGFISILTTGIARHDKLSGTVVTWKR